MAGSSRDGIDPHGKVLRVGMAYHLTNEWIFAKRAIEQIDLAASAPLWDTGHFLDTAETALAVAIGTAWLNEVISADTRIRWQAALIEKAIQPSFNGPEKHLIWLRSSNNWIQVCHASLVAAALVVEDHEPELARQTIERAIAAQKQVHEQYAPDGAYLEGPMYWEYGTTFSLLLIELLRQNYGRGIDLEQALGFLESGSFYRNMVLPSGSYFSYGDSRVESRPSAAALWFARELEQPLIGQGEFGSAIAALRREVGGPEVGGATRFLPLALLWQARKNNKPSAAPRLSLAWLGRGRNPVGAIRTAWTDAKAAAFAIKGGGAGISHAHMDAGSFVYEANGLRWAEDPGMHGYQHLELAGVKIWSQSADSERWKIFRLGPDGHNILRFGNRLQNSGRLATDLEMHEDSRGTTFTLDLTPAYEDQAATVLRTASFSKNGGLTLRDQWTGASRTCIHWQWITQATVEVAGSRIVLTQQNQTLPLHIETSEPFTITVEEADTLLHSAELPLPGVRRIRITLPGQAPEGWIQVTSQP